jgi:hypothetical protein
MPVPKFQTNLELQQLHSSDVMLSEALQRNAKHEARLSNNSDYKRCKPRT